MLLDLHYQGKERLNLADFSRKAGFKSRSYLSEILSGKKGFSADSLRKFKRTLKVNNALADVFELLVQQEYPELRNKKQKDSDIQESLNRLRSKIKLLTKSPSLLNDRTKEQVAKNVKSIDLIKTYAALGSLEKGSSLEEISKRLKLTPAYRIKLSLEKLCEFELCEFKDNRYWPKESSIDVLGVQSPNDGLNKIIDENLILLKRINKSMLSHPLVIAQISSFSIHTHRIEEFKKECMQSLLHLMDKYQSDNGDLIYTLQAMGYPEDSSINF